MIQASKLWELAMYGDGLTDLAWRGIEPLLPNEPRGVLRVDERRVLNGIFWVLRTGAPWRALPTTYGPPTTCYNRFVCWRKAGVWDQVMAAITEACDGNVQVIYTATVPLAAVKPWSWRAPTTGSPIRRCESNCLR